MEKSTVEKFANELNLPIDLICIEVKNKNYLPLSTTFYHFVNKY